MDSVNKEDLIAVTDALNRIEEKDENYKQNLIWIKLNELRNEISIEIARQQYEYLTNKYAGEKNQKYWKDLRACEYFLKKGGKDVKQDTEVNTK